MWKNDKSTRNIFYDFSWVYPLSPCPTKCVRDATRFLTDFIMAGFCITQKKDFLFLTNFMPTNWYWRKKQIFFSVMKAFWSYTALFSECLFFFDCWAFIEKLCLSFFLDRNCQPYYMIYLFDQLCCIITNTIISIHHI